MYKNITRPTICPGGYPVEVRFESPKTSRYLVRMWVDFRAIGERAKMFRGRMQGNKIGQTCSGDSSDADECEGALTNPENHILGLLPIVGGPSSMLLCRGTCTHAR